jgi:hypothetical protein
MVLPPLFWFQGDEDSPTQTKTKKPPIELAVSMFKKNRYYIKTTTLPTTTAQIRAYSRLKFNFALFCEENFISIILSSNTPRVNLDTP